MTDRSIGLIFIFLMLLSSFAFQLQSKHLATALGQAVAGVALSPTALFKAVLNPHLAARLLVVLALAGLTFVLWMVALVRLELSFALPFAAAGLAFHTIAAGLILQEQLTIGRVLGILIIVAGILIVVKN